MTKCLQNSNNIIDNTPGIIAGITGILAIAIPLPKANVVSIIKAISFNILIRYCRNITTMKQKLKLELQLPKQQQIAF